ncbi:hypothetical protein FV282_23435, partial [Escherichia coli]|uniref:hypothetical protein n=1 Tax=Escherichia coli TaxID=562 RepID=UPI0011D65C1E
MTRFFLAALAFACAVSVAHAAEVIATVPTTAVEFSAAPWIALLREILLTAVVPVVAGYVIQALRRTYPMVGLFFTQRRVEQLGNAVTEFGINAIPG